MTDLLERTAAAPLPLDRPPHDHSTRCWWHPTQAAWVCPPPGVAT